MNLNIEKEQINNLINDYNSDVDKRELEFIFKKDITEDVLNKILKFISKTTKKKPKLEYILDIDISQISNNHRLSYKSNNNDILLEHCKNEKENNFDDAKYDFEYKNLINKYDINDYNIRVNLKEEYIDTDEYVKTQFKKNYSKFIKFYRFKKRYTFEMDNYNIDVTIVKSNKGRNIYLTDLANIMEKYEIEIECKNKTNIDIVINILKYFSGFIQLSNNSYFINDNNLNKEIIDNYRKLLTKSNIIKSIGPKPISLSKKTIDKMLLSKEDLYNVKDYDESKLYYKITDKADGFRYFMYINELGQIYLVNDNNNLIQTGLQIDLSKNNNFKDCVLDGEYMFYDNKYEYKFFDFYILDSNIIYNKLLDERIEQMNILDDLINSENIINYLDKDINIKISKKPYYEISEFENMLLNTDGRGYTIDGIIFMPTISLNNINSISFENILKYKPLDFNSIDVLVKDNKLYCGSTLSNNKYVLSELQSFKPYIYNLHSPNNIYNEKLEPIDWTKLNNKVIEIRLDNKSNKLIFMTFRYDKTIKYNNSNKKSITANNIDIIQDIISNTYNPIDVEILKNLDKESIKNISVANNYYVTNNKSARNDIRRINNQIKKEMIQYSLDILESIQTKNEDFSSLKVLDLACGRGGDLYKFIQTNFNDNILKETGGIEFILGIDYDSNNIEYYNNRGKSNNARARFLEYKNEFLDENSIDNIPKIYKNNSVYYITGDINLYDGDDDVSISDIFDDIMNLDNEDFKDREKHDFKLLTSIDDNYDFDLFAKEQFELINCQFSIHYFNLENFTKLVNMFLKPNGLFICTFMEKEFVLDLLGDNDVVSGDFWSLKRSDDENKILVKFETLEGDYKEENLVSKDLIINEFSKYSINPYKDTLVDYISDRPYYIESVFDFKNHNKLKFSKNPELNFSKLYSYIIFEKSISKENLLSGIQNITN